MKTILPISDIHSDKDVIDMLIAKFKDQHIDFITISGDVLEKNSDYNLVTFKMLLDAFPMSQIVFIAGNHDYHSYKLLVKALNLDDKVHYLENESKVIDGVKFYGSPLSTPFCDWNHMKPEDQIYQVLDSTMSNDIDVALFHAPPHGYGDVVTQRFVDGKCLGSYAILKAIKKFIPTYAFYGHIHSADHSLMNICEKTMGKNVSLLDEYYTANIDHIEIVQIEEK